MSTVADHYRRLFQYEQDSHTKVLKALQDAPDEAKSTTPYHTAVDVLAHTVAARMIWLWRIGYAPERPATVFPKGLSLSEVETLMMHMHQLWTNYFETADDTELARILEYATLDGRPFQNSVEEILTQLHGHSMYHRGQISTWLRQAGAEPAPTDYILWCRDHRG